MEEIELKMKRLAAILLAGVLTAGMMSSAVSAEDIPTTIEVDDTGTETPENPEAPVDEVTEAPVDPETPETPAEPTEPAAPEAPVADDPVPETPAPEAAPTTDPAPAAPNDAPSNIGEAAAGTVAKIGETEYKTLQEAVAVAPSGTETVIELVTDVSLTDTVEIPAEKIITLTSASDVSIERSEAEGSVFAGHMFTVNGTLKINTTGTGLITVMGDLSEPNKASGYIINIPEGTSGIFQMEDGVTLMRNAADTAVLESGSAVANNSASGIVKIYGGSVTGNSGLEGCGVYSKGKVCVKGRAAVNTNTGSETSENSADLLLDGDTAVLVLDGSLEGSISMSLKNPQKGAAAVQKGEGVTDEVLAASLSKITYESEFYQLGKDGTLKAVPFLITDNAAGKWVNHNSASVTFRTTQDCKYNVKLVSSSATDDEIMAVEFDSASAKALAKDQTITETIDNLPDEDILILVIAKVDKADIISRAVFSIEGTRPSVDATVTPSPTPSVTPTVTPTDTPVIPSDTPTPIPATRDPYVPGIDATIVRGFENPLDFTRPNVSYTFQVIGAGTENRNNAVKSDVMWEPLYFSTVSNPSDAQKIYPNKGVWSIAIKNGGTITEAKTIPVYVWCRKYEYDGTQWVNQRRIEAKVTSFQTASSSGSGTVTDPNNPNYPGNGSYTDPTGNPVTFGSDDTTKSAVNTADNTPVAMFMAMAVVSLAAVFAALKMHRAKYRK